MCTVRYDGSALFPFELYHVNGLTFACHSSSRRPQPSVCIHSLFAGRKVSLRRHPCSCRVLSNTASLNCPVRSSSISSSGYPGCTCLVHHIRKACYRISFRRLACIKLSIRTGKVLPWCAGVPARGGKVEVIESCKDWSRAKSKQPYRLVRETTHDVLMVKCDINKDPGTSALGSQLKRLFLRQECGAETSKELDDEREGRADLERSRARGVA